MKYNLLVLTLLLSVAFCNGQSPAETLANKIAGKMKDTLSLTDSQRIQVYNINMQLHNQKIAIRQQYAGSDSLNAKIQSVENTRDSMYHIILADEKYTLYLQKKINLVNNN